MSTVSVGPFSFSGVLLAWACGLFVSMIAASWFDRKHGTKGEGMLFKAVLGALIAGRAGFVLSYLDTYLQRPISIMDIRDGGFSIWAAVIAGTLIVIWFFWRKPLSRRPMLLGVIAGTSALGIGYASLQLFGVAKPSVADVTMTSLDGKGVEISEFHGKPTVINLWASWCPPCRREMPALQDGQNANPDIHFVFANQGESADVINAYLSQEGLSLKNVLLDQQGDMARNINSQGLPTTLFLDENGKLVDVRLGELSTATLQDRLAALRSGATAIRPSKD